jgi:hypothetical protein
LFSAVREGDLRPLPEQVRIMLITNWASSILWWWSSGSGHENLNPKQQSVVALGNVARKH